MNKHRSALASISIFILLSAFASAFASTITYEYDELNRITRIHTPKGSLTVTINPQGAVNAGAQWQVNAGPWLNSGPPAQSVPAGINSLTFSSVAGWAPPAPQQITITDGETTTATGTYRQAYTVTPSAGQGGSISPQGAQTVAGGDSISFTVTPDSSYQISSVTSDCGGILSANTYTAGPITGNCAVTADFVQAYLITASVTGGNGTISPASATVISGGSQTFTVTPGAGYYASDFKADGVSQPPIVTSYTYSNVTASHSLSASFASLANGGPVKNATSGAYFATLQSAYNAANTGDALLAQALLFPESFAASRGVTISLVGGYKSDFSAVTGVTTIKGAPVTSHGGVTLGNFRISK